MMFYKYRVPLLCLYWWWAVSSSRIKRVMIWQQAASVGSMLVLFMQVFWLP
ncbi:hypothetical protein U9M48_038328 [Paspalum notatum var. saurae]|uniref:Uncharacterized protein n=1 Tax=Paspalum notatum var. saurae TaxID=547442 RepID=A0AAQ3XDF4_PASNO